MARWNRIRDNPYVKGTPFDEDHISDLFWLYVQGVSPEGLLDMKETTPDPPPKEAVGHLFHALNRYLFFHLVVKDVPNVIESWRSSGLDDDSFFTGFANMLLETIYENPSNHPLRINHNGHELITIAPEAAMEIRKDYVRRKGKLGDTQGMVALPTLRVLAERAYPHAMSEPLVFLGMQSILEQMLMEEPLDLR